MLLFFTWCVHIYNVPLLHTLTVSLTSDTHLFQFPYHTITLLHSSVGILYVPLNKDKRPNMSLFRGPTELLPTGAALYTHIMVESSSFWVEWNLLTLCGSSITSNSISSRYFSQSIGGTFSTLNTLYNLNTQYQLDPVNTWCTDKPYASNRATYYITSEITAGGIVSPSHLIWWYSYTNKHA